jgi:tetratricopeptide (TPR) repeat protein
MQDPQAADGCDHLELLVMLLTRGSSERQPGDAPAAHSGITSAPGYDVRGLADPGLEQLASRCGHSMWAQTSLPASPSGRAPTGMSTASSRASDRSRQAERLSTGYRMANMPLLSLCLIARDEEEMLPGCLASARDAVDEIVLVDTGSRDATLRIAREMGAHIAQVPWNDDFSAPRNAAFALATGDWVLVLDADERLAPGSGARLRASLAGSTFDCGMVRLHNASSLDAAPEDVVTGKARLGPPMPLPRVLRRAPDLRYTGVVHESVSDWLAARGTRTAPLDVDIVHLGAISEVRERRGKRDRNLTLLRRRCELEPGSITPLGYLALELISRGDLRDAKETVERGWALLDSQPGDISVLRLAVARAIVAVETSAPAVALDSVDRAVHAEGAQPDLLHLRGRALVLQALRADGSQRVGALLSAEAAFRAAISLAGRDGLRQYVAGASSWASWNGIGEVMLCLDRHAVARDAFGLALALCPGDKEAGLGEAEALLRADPGRALARVEHHLDARPDGWLLAGMAARALGATTDARALVSEAVTRMENGFRALRRATLLARVAKELGIAHRRTYHAP